MDIRSDRQKGLSYVELGQKTRYNFQCYTFGKREKGNCSPHHIREMELMKIGWMTFAG